MANVLAELMWQLRRNKELAERALAQVDDADFFTATGGEDNSIALIVKHLAGNLRSRWRDFLVSDGEKPDRNRDAEFEQLPADTRAGLMDQWESGWRELFAALEPLNDADLDRTVTIRGEPLSVLQAVVRQVAHYAYHVGQIVLLAKHHAGDRWQSLSIPRGASAAFNSRPESYRGGRRP